MSVISELGKSVNIQNVSISVIGGSESASGIFINGSISLSLNSINNKSIQLESFLRVATSNNVHVTNNRKIFNINL